MPHQPCACPLMSPEHQGRLQWGPSAQSRACFHFSDDSWEVWQVLNAFVQLCALLQHTLNPPVQTLCALREIGGAALQPCPAGHDRSLWQSRGGKSHLGQPPQAPGGKTLPQTRPGAVPASPPCFGRPTIGGKYCLGERKRYRSCNTDVSGAGRGSGAGRDGGMERGDQPCPGGIGPV